MTMEIGPPTPLMTGVILTARSGYLRCRSVPLWVAEREAEREAASAGSHRATTGSPPTASLSLAISLLSLSLLPSSFFFPFLFLSTHLSHTHEQPLVFALLLFASSVSYSTFLPLLALG